MSAQRLSSPPKAVGWKKGLGVMVTEPQLPLTDGRLETVQ
jgi:hypothetical protein